MADCFDFYNKPCKDTVGGIKRVFLLPFVEYNEIEVRHEQMTLTKFPESTIYQYDVEGSYTQATTFEKGNVFFTHTVNIDMPKVYGIDDIHKYLNNDFRVIVETNNDQFIMFGTYNGMTCSATNDSGREKSEFNGFSLTFEGKENQSGLLIDSVWSCFDVNTVVCIDEITENPCYNILMGDMILNALWGSPMGVNWFELDLDYGGTGNMRYLQNNWIIPSDDINYSINAVDWTTYAMSSMFTFVYDMAYGNGTWVVSGFKLSPTHNTLAYSTEVFPSDVSDWTVSKTETASSIVPLRVIYDNGIFVVSLFEFGVGTKVAKSTDGISWSETAVIFDDNAYDATYNGDGRWVLVGMDSLLGKIAYSDDNWVTWNMVTLSATHGLSAGKYGGDRWVAGAAGGSDVLYYSTDGINWTGLGNDILKAVRSLAYDGTYFYALGNDDLLSPTKSIVLRSADAITWTQVFSSTDDNNLSAIVAKF